MPLSNTSRGTLLFDRIAESMLKLFQEVVVLVSQPRPLAWVIHEYGFYPFLGQGTVATHRYL